MLFTEQRDYTNIFLDRQTLYKNRLYTALCFSDGLYDFNTFESIAGQLMEKEYGLNFTSNIQQANLLLIAGEINAKLLERIEDNSQADLLSLPLIWYRNKKNRLLNQESLLSPPCDLIYEYTVTPHIQHFIDLFIQIDGVDQTKQAN